MNAHDRLLNWCRSEQAKKSVHGMPCMRTLGKVRPELGVTDTHRIVDTSSFSSAPIASGNSWEEVLERLQALGERV